jgi:hypothetical protein
VKNLPLLLKNQYHVLVDDLDIHWHDTPIQNAFLAALFTSLRKLNNSDTLKFVVALRERIYKRLPLVDRDKLADWVCPVEWDAPNVREMVQRRVALAINCREAEVWEEVFPKNAFELLWNRTTGRPREMIRLVAQCLSDAQYYGHRTVEHGDIGTAVRKFSIGKLEDLGSDLGYRYHGIDALVRRMTGWPKEFPLNRVADLAIAVWMDLEGSAPGNLPYKWAGVYSDDPLGLARVFLETGVLMLKQSRTAPAQIYDPEVHTELRPDMWFAVHPMYAPGLDCIGE